MRYCNFILSLSAFLLYSCATVPYTNRKALNLISLKQEFALGEEVFKEVLRKSKLSQDAPQCELIRKTGERIARVANRPEYKWEFVLIDDTTTINAFCLPGGKVAFYSGILPLCKSEEGIAVVMGHEIAHAIARHGAERMSQRKVASFVGDVLSIALSEKSPTTRRVILEAYGLGATIGVILPYSRKHEYEADYIGMILMAKAGYNPQEALKFWKRMLEFSKGKKKIPDFLSTHPNDEKRIKQIEKNLPIALSHYTK